MGTLDKSDDPNKWYTLLKINEQVYLLVYTSLSNHTKMDKMTTLCFNYGYISLYVTVP